MTLRDRVSGVDAPDAPNLSTVADYAEYLTFITVAFIVLTIAALGVTGAVLGFSVALVVGFGNVLLGALLFGGAFFALSLIIGFFEDTYTEPPQPEELADEREQVEREEQRPPREVQV